MRRFSIAILICLLSIASALGQELAIPNASFEKAGEAGLPEGWGLITKDGQGKIALDQEVAHSGKSSLLLSGVELKDKVGVVLYLKPSLKEPLKDQSFKASIWYRTEKHQGTTMFKIEGINEKRNKNLESYITLIPAGTTNGWKKAELKFQVKSPETRELWINLYMREGCGKVWFDDLKLELTAEELQAQDVSVKIGFEEEVLGKLPKGWVVISKNGDGEAKVDEIAKEGKRSLLLTSKTGLVRVGANPIADLVPEAGKRYKVSTWCRSEEMCGDIWLKIEFVNKERNKVLGTFFLSPQDSTSDWYLLEGVTGVIPEGTAEAWLNLNLGGSGKLWFDEIKIESWQGSQEDLKQNTKKPLPTVPAPPKDSALRHPCIYVNHDEVEALRALGSQSPFQEIAQQSLSLADAIFGTPLPAEPDPYPNGWEVNHWRKMREVSSLVSGNMEKLGFAYLITGDSKYAEECKRWINLVCSWDVNGTTSTKYHDDLGRWLLWNMSKAVDWIYDTLTEKELAVIRPVILVRGRELYQVQVRPLAGMPYDSHAVSAVCYLTCAGLAISDLPEAQEWLDFSTKFYTEVYPPWGGKEGGWSEGLGYWKASMTEALEAAELLKVAGLADIYGKDWYQNTAYFKLYFDQVGKKTGNAFSDGAFGENLAPDDYRAVTTFAGITGNPYFKWYAKQLNNVFGDLVNEYFFRFRYGDKLDKIEAEPPYALPRSKVFYDVGWVALHSDLINAGKDVNFFLKSCPLGSWSHSHGEQNSFTITAWGEPLVVSGGYYDWYGSPHHFDFTRQSRSKNTILVNGEGQHYRSRDAKGEIIEFFTGAGFDLTTGDAGGAYAGKLNQFTRQILYCVPDYFLVVDSLQAPEPSYYNWLLHTISPGKIDQEKNLVRFSQNGVNLDLQFLLPASLNYEQTDRYLSQGDALTVFKDGEVKPESEYLKQYHMAATTSKPNTQGQFVSVLYPYKEADLSFDGRENGDLYEVRAKGVDRRDLTIFNLKGIAGQLQGEGIEAKGKLASASWQNDQVKKLFLYQGNNLILDGTEYLTASNPSTITVDYLPQGSKLMCRLSDCTILVVRLASRPGEVVLNGSVTASFEWKDNSVVLPLQAGEHTVLFREEIAQETEISNVPCLVVEDGKKQETELSGRFYSTGDQAYLGTVHGSGVYQLIVSYRNLAADDAKIEVLMGSRSLDKWQDLPAEDGWQRRVFDDVKIMDVSNFTITIPGNGLGQSSSQLGQLKFELTRPTCSLPKLEPDESLLEHGIVIMAEDFILEEGGAVVTHEKPAAYRESTIMNWGPDGHRLVWSFDVPKTDDYIVVYCGASNFGKFVRELKIDEQYPTDGVGLLEATSTGGWGTNAKEHWKWFLYGESPQSPYSVRLEKGAHTIELTSIGSSFLNLNYILLLPKSKFKR